MRGAKVALIEAKDLGGTCVNVGCVPKKVMWHGAQVAEAINLYAEDYGFDVEMKSFDWSKLIASRTAYIDRIHQSYDRVLGNNKVEVIKGFARFVSKEGVDSKTIEVNGEYYTANHILIAVGGRPTIPNIPGAEYGIDSNGFFALEEQPKRVAVVGAGYIAVEIAGVLHALGTETHLFVRKESPLRSFDPMVIDTLTEVMAEEGPTLHTHSVPKEVIKEQDGSLTLVLENGNTHNVDQLIWAIGRHPATDTINLQATGVEANERGYIKVDEYQNTNVEGIYCVGDIMEGGIELTPVAVNGQCISATGFMKNARINRSHFRLCWSRRLLMAKNFVARKWAKQKVQCIAPDVCLTQVGNTVVPLPYPISECSGQPNQDTFLKEFSYSTGERSSLAECSLFRL